MLTASNLVPFQGLSFTLAIQCAYFHVQVVNVIHFSYLLLMFGMLVYGTVMVEIPIYLPAKEKLSINYI